MRCNRCGYNLDELDNFIQAEIEDYYSDLLFFCDYECYEEFMCMTELPSAIVSFVGKEE